MLAVLREGDIKGEIVFRSFGIKNFTYIKKPNFFSRSKYLLKTIAQLHKEANNNIKMTIFPTISVELIKDIIDISTEALVDDVVIT